MIAKTERQLNELSRRILCAAGADEVNARLVADHLVQANLSGDDSNGVWHIPLYIDAIEDGLLVPHAKPEVIGETDHQIVVGGNWTFGHVAAAYAMEKAIAKARHQGMAVVGLVQSHHIGRVAYYAEMAASAGMIAIVADGSYGEVYPAAGERKGESKPIAMGYPADEDHKQMFEFATAALAGVGMLDDNGSQAGSDGAAALGGHRSFALMMAIEFFGRLLQEGDSLSFAAPGDSPGRGVGMIVLRADLFHGAEEPATRAQTVVDANRLDPAIDEVIAGNGGAAVRLKRQREGVPVSEEIWKSLEEVADSLGIEGV